MFDYSLPNMTSKHWFSLLAALLSMVHPDSPSAPPYLQYMWNLVKVVDMKSGSSVGGLCVWCWKDF